MDLQPIKLTKEDAKKLMSFISKNLVNSFNYLISTNNFIIKIIKKNGLYCSHLIRS